MRTRDDIKRFKVSDGNSGLTPALSPMRGRIFRRLTRCRVAEKSMETLERTNAANGCSLSPGERVRVRASVKTNFMEATARQIRPETNEMKGIKNLSKRHWITSNIVGSRQSELPEI
jgi:hypothetical protein